MLNTEKNQGKGCRLLEKFTGLTGLSGLEYALPGNIIMTDDPMRTKMLAAHLLENSEIIYELRGMVGYSGSYKKQKIAIASVGFGESSALLYLHDAAALGGKRIVYLGECISTTANIGLREVIISNSGDRQLISQTLATARELSIVANPRNVVTDDRFQIDDGGLTGDVIDFASGVISTYALKRKIAIVAILTVSRNLATGESMEEHERQSRMNDAARLAFETLAMG